MRRTDPVSVACVALLSCLQLLGQGLSAPVRLGMRDTRDRSRIQLSLAQDQHRAANKGIVLSTSTCSGAYSRWGFVCVHSSSVDGGSSHHRRSRSNLGSCPSSPCGRSTACLPHLRRRRHPQSLPPGVDETCSWSGCGPETWTLTCLGCA